MKEWRVERPVISVEEMAPVCAECNEQGSGNSPEVVRRAMGLIRQINQIDEFLVQLRSSNKATDKLKYEEMQPLHDLLANEWHTFDLDRVAALIRKVEEEIADYKAR